MILITKTNEWIEYLMKIYRNNNAPGFWAYTYELLGQPIKGSHTRDLVKNIKRAFVEKGASVFDDTEVTLSNGFILSPNTIRAFDGFFKNVAINDVKSTPSNESIVNVLTDIDKGFNLAHDLYDREAGDQINCLLKSGDYRYAGMVIAQYVSTYGAEFIEYLNSYLIKASNFDKESDHEKYKYLGRSYFFNIKFAVSYLASERPYMGIMVYKINHAVFYPEEEIDKTKVSDDDIYDLVYENYNLMNSPKDNRVKPQGSFLEDCRAILRLKNLDNPGVNILDFHDLMEYGYYSDKIISLENMLKVSDIFKHKAWAYQVLLMLTLYCNRYVRIDDCMDRIDESSKALVDTSKLQDYDLCVQVIKYFDSIYDQIVLSE